MRYFNLKKKYKNRPDPLHYLLRLRSQIFVFVFHYEFMRSRTRLLVISIVQTYYLFIIGVNKENCLSVISSCPSSKKNPGWLHAWAATM